MGVDVLPNFLKDTTDRNRTSPFAFTGNKFEFRMPGSSVNLSDCNMVLNTAMAKSLKEFADAMEDVPEAEFEMAALNYVRDTLRDHQRIIFNGDGYSEEWPEEAARRGLANNKTTADALPCFVSPKSIQLFGEFGVLSESEVRSRYEVKLEKYNKLMNIEIRTMKRLVRRDYLPAINNYAAEVARSISEIRSAVPDANVATQEGRLRQLTEGIAEINTQLEELHRLHYQSLEIADQQERANMNAHVIIPVMEKLRAAVDAMEIDRRAPMVARPRPERGLVLRIERSDGNKLAQPRGSDSIRPPLVPRFWRTAELLARRGFPWHPILAPHRCGSIGENVDVWLRLGVERTCGRWVGYNAPENVLGFRITNGCGRFRRLHWHERQKNAATYHSYR